MRLAALHLSVAEPAGLAEFYRHALGMASRRDGANWRVGYPGRGAEIVLQPGGGGYDADRGQRYWKIGITLPDVDRAADWLRRRGVEVGRPAQFLDIGYLCHLTDPAGFAIELLQHEFECNRPKADPVQAPFGRACVGQITLRTGDILAEDAICRSLGMRLLSIQDVAPHGFDLQFYAFTQERPPSPDLWAVGNREWLWRRPYATLEFQHIPGAAIVRTPDLRGIGIEGLTEPVRAAHGTVFVPA